MGWFSKRKKHDDDATRAADAPGQAAEEEHRQSGDDTETDDPRHEPEAPCRRLGVVRVTQLTCAHDTPAPRDDSARRDRARTNPRDATSPVGQLLRKIMELEATEHGGPVGG